MRFYLIICLLRGLTMSSAAIEQVFRTVLGHVKWDVMICNPCIK